MIHPLRGTHPGRLISLGEIMRELGFGQLLHACRILTIWSSRDEDDKHEYPPESRARQCDVIDSYDEPFRAIGFAATAVSMRKLAIEVRKEGAKHGAYVKISAEALERFQDEADEGKFFAMTLREADYYNKPRAG